MVLSSCNDFGKPQASSLQYVLLGSKATNLDCLPHIA